MFFKSANVTGLKFEPWSAESIINTSVAEINNSKLYVNQKPAKGGLRDPMLGITSRRGHCECCQQNWFKCPGHFGHMNLATPLYHAGWIQHVIKALKSVCLHCFEPIQHRKKTCTLCLKEHKIVQKHDVWFIQINQKPLLPCEALELLKKIKNNDAEHAILTVLPIPPNCVRPSPTMGGDEIRGEDDLTRTLLRIVRMNNTVKKHLVSQTPRKIVNILKKLQEVINGYIYRARNSSGRSKINSKTTCIGDRLRHKTGRLRGTLMGKRCNFTARGVVGPDSKMGMHEVGIPQFVADTLTITENIHKFNIDKWQNEINNKSNIIKFIVRADGKRLDVRYNNPQIQIGWKVERKLQNGDIGLFNRQPSLHKMSIMAHYVKILPGKTFRLNLSCTTPYNADFDGDEMNFHALQTVESRAEAENLMAVKHNIITPQSHRPVMSFVMDAFLGTFEISRQDTFLNKSEIMSWAMEIDNFELPIPAIVNPERWTGKQALSMLLPKTFRYRCPKAQMNEELNNVVIWDGNVLYGQFAKKVLGRSQGSLVHVLYNDYGEDICVNFINKLQLGIHRWFSEQGFSIGIEDCLCSNDTQIKIEEEYQKTLKEAVILTKEHEINARLNQARDGMGRAALKTIHRKNRLFRMVISGVKGSMMNILQIMAMVGQQNSGGKRMVKSIGDKTLPCFPANDKRPESLGMVRSPYIKGMNPAEFFFSGMVGRDGLIDTAINTAVTGYIQRRLVKALESSKTEWDGTVRDANGSIIQFKYGEDGFDGKYLEMNGIEINNVSFKEMYDWGNTKEITWLREAKEILSSYVNTLPTCFNVDRQIKRYINCTDIPVAMPHEIWKITEAPLKRLYDKNILVWALVIQHMAAKKIACYYKLTIDDTKKLMEAFESKYEYSLIPAGEMVGTLAAQSLGEPVTQMTLNTFHHAGQSSKNITMGIPRFEELINASKSPRTPTCSIVFGKKYGAAEIDKAVDLAFKIKYIVLRDVVLSTTIENIQFAKEHPEYFLMPDKPFKKIDKSNWCVKITIDKQQMVEHQMTFDDIITMLHSKTKKGINIAYTYKPLGNSIIHIGYYGKKNTKTSCANLRNKILNICIRGIENISFAEPCIENGTLSVETIGTNIGELNKLICKYPTIQTVRSNDPFDVLKTFGIEAARKTLFEQIHMVLSFDGSYVNIRHYQVLVEWMTHKGHITATTRHGIAKYSEISPIARATFEQPVEICLSAAAGKKLDPLNGISEQLLMGIPPKIGTQVLDVIQTPEYQKIIKTSIESDSEDDDEGWISFDHAFSNPFENKQQTQHNVKTINNPIVTPMWSRPSIPKTSMWSKKVLGAVGQPPTMDWNQSQQFQPPTMGWNQSQQFQPPTMGWNQPQQFQAPAMNWNNPKTTFKPTSPSYDPFRPDSPEYDPNKPMSPAYDPNKPMSPAYDPDRPMSPEYLPNSPKAPDYKNNDVYRV